MRLFGMLFPYPALTVLLTVTWMMLQDAWSAGGLVFGLILGTAIPVLSAAYWPDRKRLHKPQYIVGFVVVVLRDILVANFVLALIIVFMPVARMKPAWISVPLELRTPEAIAILASVITLTPGTLTAEMSSCGRYLLVHCLHAPDPDEVRDQIKWRYERRLKEIFG